MHITMPERESYDLGTAFLRLEREGHLACCTIDRPASRNALICQGGGLLIAMLSDVAVASERATFRAPELLLGIADTGYSAYLPTHIGVDNARDLLFTARTLAAEEARRMGLISRVVPHERLREEAVAVAESILRTAPEARLHVKRIINERYGHVDRMSMDWSLFRGPEAREGMRAFTEKRAPSWIPTALQTKRRP